MFLNREMAFLGRPAKISGLALLAAIVVSLVNIPPAESQQRTASTDKTLRRLNAFLNTGSTDKNGNIVQLWIKSPTADHLAELVMTFPKLSGIVLCEMHGASDPEILRQLEHLPALESLSLDTPMSDQWAEALSRLNSLKSLSVRAGSMSNNGVMSLSRLKSTESLNLSVGAQQFQRADDEMGANEVTRSMGELH